MALKFRVSMAETERLSQRIAWINSSNCLHSRNRGWASCTTDNSSSIGYPWATDDVDPTIDNEPIKERDLEIQVGHRRASDVRWDVRPTRNKQQRGGLKRYVGEAGVDVIEEYRLLGDSMNSERDDYRIDFELLKRYRDSMFNIVKKDICLC